MGWSAPQYLDYSLLLCCFSSRWLKSPSWIARVATLCHGCHSWSLWSKVCLSLLSCSALGSYSPLPRSPQDCSLTSSWQALDYCFCDLDSLLGTASGFHYASFWELADSHKTSASVLTRCLMHSDCLSWARLVTVACCGHRGSYPPDSSLI